MEHAVDPRGARKLVTGQRLGALRHRGVTAMLAEDATFAMPPLRNWYQGREAIAVWAANLPMSADEPPDAACVEAMFGRFGLPSRLD